MRMADEEIGEHLLVKIEGEFMIAWRPCAAVFDLDGKLSDIECALAESPDNNALIFRRDLYEGRRSRLMRLCRV